MVMPQIILIGAGGHARSCIDVIECQGVYQVAGLVGLSRQKDFMALGYSVIATDGDLHGLVEKFSFALIAVGQIKTSERRELLFNQAETMGFLLPSIIAPTAKVSRHAALGAGTIVMHGATINAGARIGKNCIVNTNALIEHDAVVGDHCHISTGAIINGSVSVGSGSFIGSGSLIKENIKIESNCVVGMGVVLRHDLNRHSHFLGDRSI